MKKQLLKIGFILMILGVVLATTVSADFIGDITNNMGDNTTGKDTVKNTANTILGVIEVVGTGIAVIMLLYIGLKYIMASPEGKADYKKTAVMYTIGAAILFAAPRLVNLIIKVTENVTSKL